MFQPVIDDEQFKLNLHCPSFVPSCSSNLLSPPNLLQQTPPATAPPAKRQKLVVPPTPTVSPDLGTYIARDVELLKKLGWKKFVKSRRTRSDFANLSDLPHPAKRLLQHYKSHGAPVKFKPVPGRSPRYVLLSKGALINHVMNILIFSRKNSLT